MKRLKLALVAGLAIVALPLVAFAAGLFPGFPIVGGASYCNGYATGTSGQVCVSTVPAGPSALTGNELIPADTQLSQGQQPQTVTIPSSLFQTGGMMVVTTNASVVIPNNVATLVSNQTTATIALVTLPNAPKNNQIVRIANAGSGVLTLTSIAVAAGSGQSIVGGAAPATLAIQTTGTQAAVADVAYQYQSSDLTWYRIH